MKNQVNEDKEISGESVEFACKECPRVFRTQGGLNGHGRAHSFWSALSKLPDQAERKKQREDLNASIVVAAIHHYTVNKRPAETLGAAPHCDVCGVVSGVDKLLVRDLHEWLKTRRTSATGEHGPTKDGQAASQPELISEDKL